MQEWSTSAIILSKRPFGETSAVVNIFTPDKGLCIGLFKGAKSKKNRAVIEPGNLVNTTWKARLNDQLGVFDFELIHSPFAGMLGTPRPLMALKVVTNLISLSLAEREPHPTLYSQFLNLIQNLKTCHWIESYVRFEILLLQELGFGLTLDRCAVTGSQENLTYVSPKTGRSVTHNVGAPYAPQLLELPDFLTKDVRGDSDQYTQALKLTGYFLEKHVIHPSKKDLLSERLRLVEKDDILKRG